MKEFDFDGSIELDAVRVEMTRIAQSVGMQIPTWHGKTKAAVKTGDFVGHHSIVMPADFESQLMIARQLRAGYPDARFILEEKDDGELSLQVTEHSMGGWIFVIDPIDGSSQLNAGLPSYSVSIGLVSNGRPAAGAVCAPMILGGFTASGFKTAVESGCTTFVENGMYPAVGRIEECALKDAAIFMGNDALFTPQLRGFAPRVAQEARVSMTPNSCALGMALVAAGKAAAIYQPHHYPWDWAAGAALIEAAGGRVQYFNYRNRHLEMMEKPDLLSYQGRNTGFISGNKRTVNDLHALLQETFIAE